MNFRIPCLAMFALASASCATLTPNQANLAFGSALAVEASAQVRCPRTTAEDLALVNVRILFDTTVAPHLSPDQITQLKSARDETARVCAAPISG